VLTALPSVFSPEGSFPLFCAVAVRCEQTSEIASEKHLGTYSRPATIKIAVGPTAVRRKG